MKKSTPALSHEPPKVVAGEKNESLAGLIEPYADGQFAELPEGVCERVIEAFSSDSWDKLKPFQRRSLAQDDDAQHDPTMRSQSIYFFELSNTVGLVKSDITELELMQPQSITEKLAKENKLSELHDKLNKLQALEKQPAPVVTVGASSSLKPDNAGAVKPLQRTAAQDSAILFEIKIQGYDPLALPKNLPGKPGVKATIRAALLRNSLFAGGRVFDKAWERLTARADIAIQG